MSCYDNIELSEISLHNSVGFITFVDYGNEHSQNVPKYMRFACMENCELTCKNVYKLLVEQEDWKIETPKLIISINGSLRRTKSISKQHKRNFKQGLINVIETHKTWIFRSGFNVGIHKLVTETITEYRQHHKEKKEKDQVSFIGISSFGSILNHDQLCSPQFTYRSHFVNKEGKPLLDPYYDYFLFCDGGSSKKYGVETDFRLKFESYMREQIRSRLVQIVYEGEKQAIKNAYNALSDKVPLVIMKGTGRAADIISEVMELPIKNYKDNIYDIVNGYIERLDLSENKEGSNEIVEYTNYLLKMHKDFKDLIVIYDIMDTEISFDKKILEAMIIGLWTFIKDDDKRLKKTLKLCIKFNCPNIADKLIFSNWNYFDVNSCQLITDMFKLSLKENKSEFVQLFIENKFDVDKFISTDGILLELYKISSNPEKCQCAELLSGHKSLSDIGDRIQKLSNYLINNRYKNYKENSKSKNNPDSNGLKIQDLFLWALLSGYTDLSEIFWKSGEDQTGSALIASFILKNMASFALRHEDVNLEQKLTEASKKYQDLAASIITECYSNNKKETHKLLKRDLKNWDRCTCLEIAMKGKMFEFLSLSACRSYTRILWMGHLHHFLSLWKIILAIPFSLIWIISNRTDIILRKETTKEESIEVNSENKLLNPQHKKPKSGKIPIAFEDWRMFNRAPIVKFYINVVTYIVFLVIFSYLNLVELKPISEVKRTKQKIISEICVYIYLLAFIIEEIRQVIDQNIQGWRNKIRSYYFGVWNKFDAVIILLSIISIITRFTIADHHFMICRCFFSITLSMCFMRFMQFYFVNKSIGPKIIMIRDMLLDISFFLSIFVLSVMAYGTLAHALRYPNSNVNWNLITHIIYMPYFQTYGELMMENFEVSGPCNGTDCFVKGTFVIFSFGVFLLFTNILLINLLIAMFGYTFSQIQTKSENLYCFTILLIAMEFKRKPCFPAPFNIIENIVRIICLTFKTKCEKKNRSIQNKFEAQASLILFEKKICGAKYLIQQYN